MKVNYTRPICDFLHPVQTVIHADQTIEEALNFLREKHVDEEIIYIYVVDEKKRLVGVVPTRKLLLSDLKTPVSDVMQVNPVHLNHKQRLREAIEFLESHRLLALPVVDEGGRLLGVVDVRNYLDGHVDVANARHRQDIFQIMGIVVEEGKRAGVWLGYRNRMPWIFCNMLGGFACALISRFYEVVLAKFLVLAMFIPLLLTLSESISMQSMTQSMQLLRRSKRPFLYACRVLLREWQVVSMLAISSGIIVGSVSFFWGDGLLPALNIAFGIMFSVFITASVGAIIPLVLHARKWDPRVAAGPVVLMFADVLTTLIYLGLATWWLL